jgi:hypothetical protein
MLLPHFHLQNHCPDSVGPGEEDCEGGEVIVFHPVRSDLQSDRVEPADLQSASSIQINKIHKQ